MILVLSLVALRWVDAAALAAKRMVRVAIPSATILLPVAIFLSMVSPSATRPNGLIYVAFAGALLLATALFHVGDAAGAVSRQPRPSRVACRRAARADPATAD